MLRQKVGGGGHHLVLRAFTRDDHKDSSLTITLKITF